MVVWVPYCTAAISLIAAVTLGVDCCCCIAATLQGGVAVSAWVFGHQLFDILGLLLHPATFYAWLYVLTLSQVRAIGQIPRLAHVWCAQVTKTFGAALP
jgi:uncharacterized membrane-anchored protein